MVSIIKIRCDAMWGGGAEQPRRLGLPNRGRVSSSPEQMLGLKPGLDEAGTLATGMVPPCEEDGAIEPPTPQDPATQGTEEASPPAPARLGEPAGSRSTLVSCICQPTPAATEPCLSPKPRRAGEQGAPVGDVAPYLIPHRKGPRRTPWCDRWC